MNPPTVPEGILPHISGLTMLGQQGSEPQEGGDSMGSQVFPSTSEPFTEDFPCGRLLSMLYICYLVFILEPSLRYFLCCLMRRSSLTP